MKTFWRWLCQKKILSTVPVVNNSSASGYPFQVKLTIIFIRARPIYKQMFNLGSVNGYKMIAQNKYPTVKISVHFKSILVLIA